MATLSSIVTPEDHKLSECEADRHNEQASIEDSRIGCVCVSGLVLFSRYNGWAANVFEVQRVGAYLEKLREVMRRPELNFFCIAADATRLSRRDTQFAVIYSPEMELGAWCPPQVPRCETVVSERG